MTGPGLQFDSRMSDSDALMWRIEKDPLLRSTINVTLLSNVDRVDIGINADLAALPDPDELVASLRSSFDEILALA